jgi:hypothetical protein
MITTLLGDKIWKNSENQFHRIDGPAIIQVDGSNVWYLNGERHRDGGPAVDWVNGYKEWWVQGIRHREDGPAVIWMNGYLEWYYHGTKIDCSSNEEFLRIIKMKEFL